MDGDDHPMANGTWSRERGTGEWRVLVEVPEDMRAGDPVEALVTTRNGRSNRVLVITEGEPFISYYKPDRGYVMFARPLDTTVGYLHEMAVLEFRVLSAIRQAAAEGSDLVSEMTRHRAAAASKTAERLLGQLVALDLSIRSDTATNRAADALLAEADAVLEDLLSEEASESP